MNYPSFNQVRLQLKLDLGGTPSKEEMQAEYDKRKSIHDNDVLKVQAKESYHTDVYNEMLSIFGTTQTDTAIANYETLKLKVSKPELFGTDTTTIVADAQTKIDQIEA